MEFFYYDNHKISFDKFLSKHEKVLIKNFLHKKIEKYTILEILSQIDVNKSELYNILDKFQKKNVKIYFKEEIYSYMFLSGYEATSNIVSLQFSDLLKNISHMNIIPDFQSVLTLQEKFTLRFFLKYCQDISDSKKIDISVDDLKDSIEIDSYARFYDFEKFILKTIVSDIEENTPYIVFYDKIKLLAVLQSGLSTSPISFTNVIPYEDFSEVYSKVLDKLEELPKMEDFYNLGVFQRNNWNNDDIVPNKAAIKTFSGAYNPAMNKLPKNVKNEVTEGNIPPVVSISTLSPEGKSEYIVYTWKEIPKGKTEPKMREEGDYSFMKKGLFKKVYDVRDLEYIHSANDKEYFIYKAVNAWGDAFRAQEFYDEARQSVIENGFIKVDEVGDSAIINTFVKTGKKSLVDKIKTASKSKSKVSRNLFEQKDEDIPLSEVDDSSDDKLFSEINNVNVLSLQLKDGNTYLVSEITNQMMTDMGYTPSEIGKFIKKYKC